MSMTGAAPLAAGREVAGRYVVEAVLGRGQSATVYRARDRRTESTVALKILAPHLSVDETARARFVREVRILQRLDHPNVIKVYGLEEDQGAHVIVMEFFEAVDCKRLLERSGRMTVREVVALAKTITATLEACHRLQIVHRDLKPQNILRNARGEVKLVDFGVAKVQMQSDLTRTGSVFGTPQYLAPELFRSARADPRSDLYALGVVLYECLAGRPPFVATTLGQVLSQQMRNAIEPLTQLRGDVPAWLAAAVHKCLRLDPGLRYQSAYALRRDLERGEQCVALREEGASDEACHACRAPLLLGLSFCPSCGTARELLMEPGTTTVLINRCAAPDAVADHLARQLTSPSRPIEARLRRLPAILCRGVSQRTARSLASMLSAFPCELQVAEGRWTALRVPLRYAAVGIALVLPLFWIADQISAPSRIGIIVGAETVVLGLYAWRSRPVLPAVWRTRRLSPTVGGADLEPWARALPAVRDANLRMILAHILRAYSAVVEASRRSDLALRTEFLLPAVEASFAAAAALERQALYLSGQSIGALRGAEGATAQALAQTATSTATESVARVGAALSRAARDFEALDEAHSRTYLALLDLQVVLQRLDEVLQDGESANEALEELRSTTSRLRGAAAETRDGD